MSIDTPENLPAIAPIQQTGTVSLFANAQSFEVGQRMAKALSSSDLVPQQYRGNLANCMLALEISQRVGASPLMVIQNLNFIHGRPAWSSQYIIASLNSCGRFSPLRFTVTGEGDKKQCIASAVDKSGEILEGPAVSIAMAKAEGWFGKQGSKWQTMEDLMLRYRSAAFFGRLYAPDILMGMKTADEIVDMIDITPPAATEQPKSAVDEINAKIKARAKKKPETIDATANAEPDAPSASVQKKDSASIETHNTEEQGGGETPAADFF